MSPKFTCFCGKSYQQSSHLRRHERTHAEKNTERIPCKYCDRSFARRDVWRQHLTRCSLNLDHDEAPLSKRGQKAKACDHCFQKKMACDTKHPCSRCSSSTLECTYNRLDSGRSVAPSSMTGPESQPRNPEAKMALPFLLNMTDPLANSMVDSLQVADGHDLDMTDPIHSTHIPPPAPLHLPDHDMDLPSIFTDNLSLFLDDRFFPWSLTQSHPHEDVPPSLQFPPPDPTPPEPILSEIITALHAIHTTLATDPTYDGTFSLPLAHRVFTPSNRALLVGRYYRFTHREFPLTHRPSFDLATVSPGLLLAFFLCGSVYTAATPATAPTAPTTHAFLRVAEEFVFRRLGEVMVPGEDGRVVESRELYEALQAALLVHCTQFALQGVKTRERNRTVRLPALVAAVRRLGLLGCGIFRVPPLMAISELTGDFPCLPSLWEAETEDEFNAIIAAKGPSVRKRSCSIRQAMEALMADATWPSLDQFPLRNPNVHDLHFLIHAIHSVVGSAGLMGLLTASGGVLLRATSRWEQLWREVTTAPGNGSGDDMEYLAGTMSQHLSPEMCWLARKLIEGGMDGRFEGLEYYQGAHYSLDPLHALIKRLKDS
ncbi:hypothetical protein QBC39DRAFT_282552 [Podospora conica]|nr:hypothetical protein QBC39DRAFT_282552 [Schizothecium conicum]